MPHNSCGIDFGTTNTSAACFDELIKLENQNLTIPTALFFSNESQKLFTGRKAIEHYRNGETGRLMRSLKRVLGTELMKTGTLLNGKPVLFENIIAFFLTDIKNKIEAHNKKEVENVVLGRPVHFRDNDKEGDLRAEAELKRIAQSVGFKNIDFQFEPIAGAFAHEQKLTKEKLALVIDIGGGTSDFSVIRLGNKTSSDRKNDILANSGVRIGGNDFDKALAISSFMPELGMNTTFGERNLKVASSIYFELSEWSKVNSAYNFSNKTYAKKTLIQSHDKEKYERLFDVLENEQGHNLLAEVEQSKIMLSDSENIERELSFLSSQPTLVLSKNGFEKSITTDTSKLLQEIEECLKLAQVSHQQIELIILTGGSTEIPYIQETLCKKFAHAEISAENKLSSVALGLGLHANNIFA